jgi:NAD(P)-dependent dehydrogenase (short-subunit alcohol dehydrogenase family)
VYSQPAPIFAINDEEYPVGRMNGKVATVTGGASGIGEGIARMYVKEGARVAISDIQDGEGERIAREIGNACMYLHVDVSDSAAMAQLVRKTVELFGRLDVMVNNAGILVQGVNIVDHSEEDFDRTYAVNLKGVWLGMKYAIPELEKSGGGSIINVSSIAALMGNAGQSAYGATKGGVVQLTRHCAAEVAAKRIRSNCISPGGIVTGMSLAQRPGKTRAQVLAAASSRNPLGHAGVPDDVSHAAVWLGSDESVYITGQNIVIDGGVTAIRRLSLTSQ